ncbi:endonuclease/exonuclease/phosphatase [Nonlabens tegetincola]|uniref:endonuclease/exonuclease/phosphatase family protein n=1 Tax=Nonlabens tegetincola TaxID=323273 RepID=UPI000A20B14D|nr:endonuclease/exonuclease/phosphatase [Nonlabens tegetincola]ARN72278.1 endonuclease/exonuclease/phosphatase [Nonlabens tegetincola]
MSAAIPSHAFEQYTIAFYNLENFFDVINDPNILDDDFTEFGRNEWTPHRYQKKLNRISDCISKIGFEETGKLPVIIGIAEVENKKVIKELLSQPKLSHQNYNFIHYNSPDERGIDVALIYNEDLFTVHHSAPICVELIEENGTKDYTRDILYVKGKLAGMPLDIYVNHWPSRRDGAEETNHKRVEVAKKLIAHINKNDPEKKRYSNTHETHDSHNVIILGDFNDDPENDSIKNVIIPQGFNNVTAPLKTFYRGTLNHQFKWNLFDQIIISQSLENDIPKSLYFSKANIFDDIMLRQWKGKYRGQPSRTFVGRRYKGGYSDHFPVYSVFRRN